METQVLVTSKCAIHEEVEEIEDPLCVCIECGHIFPDIHCLAESFGEIMKAPFTLEQISFCPFCLHDFVPGSFDV